MSRQDRNPQPQRPRTRRINRRGTSQPGTRDPKSTARWVTVEHRDADGNPSLPRELIASTHGRRYAEVPPDTEIKATVLKGNKPNPLLLVERKIYEVHRLAVRGWRRTGRITVELPPSRRYEADFFSAMQGARLDIVDPGLSAPHHEEAEYVITESSFDEKLVMLPTGRQGNAKVPLFEGVLDIRETWRSAWQRQSAEVLSMGFKHFLLPLLIAILAALVGLWLGRSSQSGDSPGAAIDGESPSAGPADNQSDALPAEAAEQLSDEEPVTEPLQSETDQPPSGQPQGPVDAVSDQEEAQRRQ